MKSSRLTQFIILFVLPLLLFFWGHLLFTNYYNPPSSVFAANLNTNHAQLPLAAIPQQKTVACTHPDAKTRCKNGTCSTKSIDEAGVCSLFGGPIESLESTTPISQEEVAEIDIALQEALLNHNNFIYNGNFEFGFYQVPELGFEAPDVGNVPNDWNWYKNQAYGKYVIDNNQRFGLVCLDDIQAAQDSISTTTQLEEQNTEENSPFGPIPEVSEIPSNNALALHMQSTDQMDARLGVYQTIDVVPGEIYRFSMSSTIEVQNGGRTEVKLDATGEEIAHAPNHTFEIYFDHTGNTNWRAIPFENWINLPVQEETLYFVLEEAVKKGESSLAPIQDYETLVTAQSDKLTIFITAWRKWANWRTSIFTIDCMALVPLSSLDSNTQATFTPAEDTSPSTEAQPASLTETTEPQTETSSTETDTTESQLPVTGFSDKSITLPVIEPKSAQPETNQTQSKKDAAIVSSPNEVTEQPEEEKEAVLLAEQPQQPENIPAAESTSIGLDQKSEFSNFNILLLVIIASAIIIMGVIGRDMWQTRRDSK